MHITSLIPGLAAFCFVKLSMFHDPIRITVLPLYLVGTAFTCFRFSTVRGSINASTMSSGLKSICSVSLWFAMMVCSQTNYWHWSDEWRLTERSWFAFVSGGYMLLDYFTVIIYSICIGQIVPFCVTGIASKPLFTKYSIRNKPGKNTFQHF